MEPVDTTRPLACQWEIDQRFAFDVSIDSEITFNEAALVPLLPGQMKKLGATATTQHSQATGWLDAKVLTVTSSGEAILVARLASWTSDAPGSGAFAAIDRDMLKPYLLRVDERCRVLATARPRQASLIAYRRVLGVIDRMDFVLPPADSDITRAYRSRHIDDFGWHTLSNQYESGPAGGRIERKRLGYEPTSGTADSLPVDIRVRSAGGVVTLGISSWFSEITDYEDLEVVSKGAVPLRSRARSRLQAQTPDPRAFDNLPIVLADFEWSRPDEAELQVEHERLRGAHVEGMPSPAAVQQFLKLRDSGSPGAWHDAQRFLRDWMRTNPDGVRRLAKDMAQRAYSRADQADLVLALAKSGSDVARQALEQLVQDTGADTDLRVQAASACGDLKEPTVDTVAVLQRIGATERTQTPEDILPSAATMALGSIIETAPMGAAGTAARQVLHSMLRSGEKAKTVEVLYAASNAGDASFVPIAQAQATSEQPELRAAAAHTLRKLLPSSETHEVFDHLLGEDTHPEVVKQVAESRRQQLQTYGGELTAGELSLYATKLPTAPEGVRWELLRTLGLASRLQREAKDVLVDWYANESATSLKVLIGQYVSADELGS